MSSGNAHLEGLRRNVRLYPWYAALFNAFFWMPVFFLYFGEHLNLGEVLSLEAVYYVAVVLLEVPSGYLSDRLGRKLTLVLSAASLLAAYVLFFVAPYLGGTFAIFSIAQVLLAGGIAANSGTDTSFHHDSLAGLDREGEYKDREALVARNSLFASALAAVGGGLASSIELAYAYGLSAVVALASIVLLARFEEPAEEADPDALDFFPQLGACFRQLKRPILAWLFGFAVFATVINHVPYEFYQPYTDLVGVELDFASHTPIVTGILMAVTMLIGAFVARKSAAIDDYLGTRTTLLGAGALQIVVIGTMAALLHPAILLVVLLRGVPSALMKAPLHAAVTPRIPRAQRATYLSLQSLVGRLGFAVLLGSLGWVAGGSDVESWETLSWLLQLAAVAGFVGWLALLVTGLGVAFEGSE
ncbi:MAG: MFS transporter [Myxococcota bacterium]